MKIRKNHKLLLFPLMLIGILVWAQVIIQLFHNAEIGQGNHDYVSQAAIRERTSMGLSEPDTSYIAKIEQLKNPFRINQKVSVIPQQKKIRNSIAAVISPPSLKYLGFISDENEPFALVQMPDEKSVIVKEGDHIQEFYIKSVKMDSMIVCMKKDQYTYHLIGD